MKSVKWATLLRESAAMSCLLVLLLATVAAEHHGDHSKPGGDHVEHHATKHDDRDDEYDALDTRLNKVTARLEHIEDEIDKRLDPKLKSRALSLEHHIEALEENHCDDDHYDCGASDHECVSELFVCDGTKDCRNGDDEKHCDLPTKAGDHFEGSVVFDRCTQRKPDHISFSITGVKVTPAYTAFPVIRARIEIHKDSDEEEINVSLPTNGYYKFSTQNLILLPPEDDGLGLICDFDGHDPDRCVGNIVSEASLEPCARFIFVRKHDEEHEEHDD